ncbi:MAG: ABC transporter permease [Gaiellales bacterium]
MKVVGHPGSGRLSVVVWRRIVWEQRVRLPLIVAFSFAWGFLLVTLYGHLSPQERNLGPQEVQIALRLLGIDPLAAWVTVGQEHPLFLGAATLFLVGGGVRAIAGELEGGTLELVLSRPLSRTRYLLSWIGVLVPGAAAIALAYSLGCILAWELFTPADGHLEPWAMLLSAVYTLFLLAAIAGASLLCSALSSERGRALSWAAGIVVGSYAWNFLLSLVSSLRPLARISPWWYFAPGSVIEGGAIPWLDASVLLAIALVTGGLALWIFARRDLVS